MYFIFAGASYYPCGGVDDLVGNEDTIEDALEFVANGDYDWWQICELDPCSEHGMSVVRSG